MSELTTFCQLRADKQLLHHAFVNSECRVETLVISLPGGVAANG